MSSIIVAGVSIMFNSERVEDGMDNIPFPSNSLVISSSKSTEPVKNHVLDLADPVNSPATLEIFVKFIGCPISEEVNVVTNWLFTKTFEDVVLIVNASVFVL